MRRVDLVLLTLLGAALRVLHALQVEVIFNDGPSFIQIAQSMAAGDWGAAFAHPYHPLYSAVLLVAQPLVGDWVLAGVLVSLVAGVACIPIVFSWLDDAFDRVHARLGAFLVAVHPYAIEISGNVMSDGLYLALFLGAAALLWRSLSRRRPRLAFAGGLVCAAAYLTRPEGAGLLIVAGLVGLGELIRRRLDPGTALRVISALAIGGLIGMAPYVTQLSLQRGELTFSQKKSIDQLMGLDLLRRGEPEASPVELPDAASRVQQSPRPAPVDPTHGPARWQRYPRALLEVVETLLSGARYELALLVLLGLVAVGPPPGLRGRYHLVLATLYLVLLWALLAHAGYLSRRHTIPLALSGLGYAAAGAIWLTARVSSARISRRAAWIGLVIAVAALGLGKTFRTPSGGAAAERLAAEWLRDTHAPQRPLAAAKRRVAFYAGTGFVELQLESPDVLAALRRAGAGWVIVDGDDAPTLEALDLAGDLRAVHREAVRGETAHVYELLDPEPAPKPDSRG
jgi:4-amino-4-deoxy-L-arabinose transferase-like glycosyltransferase